MKIVQIICRDVQERLFWTKNLRFAGQSALGLAAGMVLVGFFERRLNDSSLRGAVFGVCALAVCVFVYRSYRAFKERLQMDFAGQLERLNPEFEDRFATLAHLEGMNLDEDQKRIYEAIAMQVAPKVKTMRRGETGEQVLMPLLIACVFIIPASLLFPGTRNAVWRLMKQFDQVQTARGPKILKSSDLATGRDAQQVQAEVRIIKPEERLSMSLYETADVVASIRAGTKVDEVRASFWKNGEPLAPKKLEWLTSQREGEVKFTIFPEDYSLDLLDVLAYEVDARMHVGGRDVWVRSRVHIIEISPFAKDRERLKRNAKSRDLRVLDDLSSVIREQACLAAEMQKALEAKKEEDAKRPESSGKKSEKNATTRESVQNEQHKRLQQLKESSQKQTEATERVGKSCPNPTQGRRGASDAMMQTANGNSALSNGNLEEAARWHKEALQSLGAVRKEMMETLQREAEGNLASRGSEGAQKGAQKEAPDNATEKSGAEQSKRERSEGSGESTNSPDRRSASAGSVGGADKREGTEARQAGDEREGNPSTGQMGEPGGVESARAAKLERRGTIRQPEQEASAAINEYLNRPEQELLNVPPKPSSSSSTARQSGWQQAQELEIQEAINASRADTQKARDQIVQKNRAARKERLGEALQEVERYLDVLEQNQGAEKARALRAMLPEEDRRELEKRQKLPARSAVPFHERDTAESARRVSESIAKRIETGRGLSPEQLEALMRESPLNAPPERAANETGKGQGSPTNSTLQPGLGPYRVVDASTTEGKVNRDQVEISDAIKTKKKGEDEASEVDRVPVSFRTRVERYFRKLATE